MKTPSDRTTKKVTNLPTLFDEKIANQAGLSSEMFDGARLTQARQLAALTKRALADRVGVSAAAIGQYESGTIKPRPDLVMRLAEVLAVPVRFFAFRSGRPRAILDVSMAHFRSLRSTRSYERERAAAFAAQIWEATHALEQWVRLPAPDLPGWLGGEVVPDVPEDPAAAARAVRRRWGLGTEPVPHMVRLLESRGIVVAVMPFSEAERVKAFSTSRLQRPVVVLSSDKDDVYHHRFSAAHELGHLVMHGEAQPGDPEHERVANAFAAEFLMPTASISASLPTRVDFSQYARLQTLWGVSVDALLYRSRELGLLRDVPYRRAWQKLADLRSAGIIQTEPVSRYSGEQPVLLKRALELARKKGLTLETLAEEIDFSVEMISLYVGVDETPDLPLVNVVDLEHERMTRRRGTVSTPAKS
ncbi:DNA-binding protein [Actinoplanes italicus]|uniref:Zn-dependent peptidase ImmA (M78 family) n=1 Tax=Actinoplanes italicus TaxID=113567 RepID=A0A2T0KPG2_9ACTN|nr:XRE family transcriptional regulator [Actinoplanes italicus]PRX25627.1 Zn-dependent peptidase ImmA (M78 family) [Actinoplanes italicus]GIE28927.1 DNA-binding protein [Actinoplanes italicus]